LIVALGRDVVVLEVSSSVEDDLGGLHLSFLDISLVSDQNNRNVWSNSGQVLVPLGNVLVRDSGGQIEHDNSALGVDATLELILLVDFSELSELLLAGGIPDFEQDWSSGGVEWNIGDVDTSGCCHYSMSLRS